MKIRIEGTDLPGRACRGYDNVHVGVQRRNKPDELLDVKAGDAGSASWLFEGEWKNGEVVGLYVQGGPGGRFIYLSWGTVDDAGNFAMFRRAKLMLDHIDAGVLNAARASGMLVARLGLRDSRGEPVCGRLPPHAIEWAAG